MKFRPTSPIFLLSLLAFLLSGMPKVRWVFGAPIYLIDLIILYLIFLTVIIKRPRFVGRAKTLVGVIGAYFFFVLLGELRGAVVYNQLFNSIYMLFRFSLALMLPFIVPKIVRTPNDLTAVIKGLCVGLLLSAILAIFYSLPFTRSIASFIFSIKLINPVEQNAAVLEVSSALRGQTLIGTSTFSSGLMAMLWPLLYMGGTLFWQSGRWRLWCKIALFLLPLGILATYGRSAWLSVVLVLSSMMLWGSGKARLKTLFWVIAFLLLIVQVGMESDLMMVNRIVKKTQKTFDAPMESDSERERFLAYVQPFQHVVKYPSFLMAGTGAANRKFGGDAYEEAETASHAVPGMAYYAYGVGGALCQILLMISAFRLCYRRLIRARRNVPSMVWMWRALLAALFGVLPWWLFGHGIVTQPRGAMAFFLLMGIILACERIYLKMEKVALWQSRKVVPV